MKLMVGLGNPGEKYTNNRHNVGFMVVDEIVTSNRAEVIRSPSPKLVTCYVLPDTNVILAKPLTFMNSSGLAVKKLVDQSHLDISNLWVIHDDLDILLGSYKIQFRVGPKAHKGVNSIEEKLETKDFYRVRVGVDNRDPGEKNSGEDYVLQDFTNQERDILDGVIDKLLIDLIARISK